MTSRAEIERPLPHSEPAERGILGAFLAGNRDTGLIVDRLTPNDFYLPQNQKIYAAICKLTETQKAIDLLSVHEALSQADELEAAGGLRISRSWATECRALNRSNTMRERSRQKPCGAG